MDMALLVTYLFPLTVTSLHFYFISCEPQASKFSYQNGIQLDAQMLQVWWWKDFTVL